MKSLICATLTILMFTPGAAHAEATAKMRAAALAPEPQMAELALPKVVEVFKKRNDKNSQLIAGFAHVELGMKTLRVFQGDSEQATLENSSQALLSQQVAALIPNTWKPSASAQKTLSQNRELFEKSFAAYPYALAWMQFQLGEKEAAKKFLQEQFETEFQRVMKLESVVIGMGNLPPLSYSERLLETLLSVSEEREKAGFRAKMQKMKAYVSTLPEAHIVT